VLRGMMKARTGRIISIASVVGQTGNPGQANYAAAKAGIIGFTKSLAREIASRNITCNVVAPGFIDTDMTQGLGEEGREQVKRRSALRRLADVDDVANAVEFLLGDKAKNITGTVLTVDAGNTA
jgi:3-oxoacyl-[acyl-carrier protein] reductase